MGGVGEGIQGRAGWIARNRLRLRTGLTQADGPAGVGDRAISLPLEGRAGTGCHPIGSDASLMRRAADGDEVTTALGVELGGGQTARGIHLDRAGLVVAALAHDPGTGAYQAAKVCGGAAAGGRRSGEEEDGSAVSLLPGQRENQQIRLLGPSPPGPALMPPRLAVCIGPRPRHRCLSGCQGL